MRSLIAVAVIAMLPVLAVAQPMWERLERLRRNATTRRVPWANARAVRASYRPYNDGMEKGRHPNVIRTWKLGTPKSPKAPRSAPASRLPKSKPRP